MCSEGKKHTECALHVSILSSIKCLSDTEFASQQKPIHPSRCLTEDKSHGKLVPSLHRGSRVPLALCVGFPTPLRRVEPDIDS